MSSSSLNRELIRLKNGGDTLLIKENSVLQVQLNYKCGSEKRLSKSTFYLRVSADLGVGGVDSIPNESVLPVKGTSAQPGSVPNVRIIVSADAAGTRSFEIELTSSNFAAVLSDKLVKHMMGMQSEEVVYKSVDLIIYQPLTWDAGGFAEVNGGLVRKAIYRYKSGGAATGSLPLGTHISTKSVAYDLYGVSQSSTYSKPSRFLVLGSSFQSEPEARRSRETMFIEDFFNSYILFEDAQNRRVSFIPLTDTLGYLREIQTAQFEGLSNVAGAKSKPTPPTP